MSPINGFSVGRDVTLQIQTSYGPMSLNLITSFESKPDMIDQKIKGLDGITRHVRFPDGWQGRFEIERMDDTLDTYFANIESDYYAGVNEQPCLITQTVQEANGSTSQYRYTGVLLKWDEAGSWGGDKTVKMNFSFVAQRRFKIA